MGIIPQKSSDLHKVRGLTPSIRLPVLCLISLAILCFFSPSVTAKNLSVTVGVYDNKPKVFTAEDGKPSGIFVDIIEHIAKIEGWELRYVPGTWAEGLDRLAKGEIDLMPDLAYTAEREKKYSFHKVPVLFSWSQVYARKGIKVQSILDLNEKRIAVLEGSVQQDAFERFAGGFGLKFALISVPDYKTMFETVSAGEADAAITNRFFGLLHSKKYSLEDTAVIFDPSNLFFATPLNDPKHLLQTIDNHLANLKTDHQSEYYSSLRRWTSEDVRFMIPNWMIILGLIVVIVIFMSLIGSIILKRQVNEQTEELKLINKELELRISEGMEAHKALEASELKYRELVEHANSIILRWTHEGVITFLNEFGQRFFGYTADEIIGRHVMGTIVPAAGSDGDDLQRLMEEICTDPLAFEQNVNENIRRSGERVWIAWTNKIVRDAEGRVSEILSVGTDITDLKRAEDAIRELNAGLEQRVAERTSELAEARDQAEAADRIKSAFLATMSHELRTPLNSIIGFTGIILQGLAGPLNPEQAKQMGMVRSSAQHLLSLINDVLDISKIEAGQLEVYAESFDVRTVTGKAVETLKPLAEKKGLDINTSIEPEVAEAMGDRRRVEQVLLNLISNAVKYTENGGVRIDVSVDPEYHPKGADTRTHSRYPAIRFRISDTGIGIRQEDLVHLFQPFRQIDTGLTRKTEGTGLGLAICRRLAGLMGGEILAESEWGKGSVFTFILPLGGMIHQ